jgi:hypothetical protein
MLPKNLHKYSKYATFAFSNKTIKFIIYEI